MRSFFRSLRFVLSAVMSAVALLAMVSAIVPVYHKVVQSIEQNLAISAAQVVDQAADTLSIYVQGMIDVTESIIADIDATEAPGEELRELLSAVVRLRQDIASVAVASSRGALVAYAPALHEVKPRVDVRAQEWFPKETLPSGGYYITPPHVQNLFTGQYPWVVTLYRDVPMVGPTGEPYVLTLVMDMNFDSIEQYCSALRIGKRGYVFILDENNNIIYHPQQQVIYSGSKTEDVTFIGDKEPGTYIQADSKLVIIRPVGHTGWKLVGISYLDDYRVIYQEIVRHILIVMAVVLALVFVLAGLTSRQVSRPISRLAARIEALEGGALAQPAEQEGGPEEGFDEVRRLSASYSKMTVRIRELMEQIKREQQLLRKTELRALQAQINPHFLYNTLDSILWMCEQQEYERAVVMVSALSRLFRISISKGSEMITLREELIHARSYLTIQQMRYKDQFKYVIDADESLLDCKCLKVMLQPLLENAITHGLDRMVDKGLLSVTVRGEGETVVIRVTDNGLGMDLKVLEEIFIPKKESDNKYGIGVANVHSRIQIYFGREYGLDIDSVPDEGTCVTIRFPMLRGGTEE